MIQHFKAISEVNENMPLLKKLLLQDNEVDGCGMDGIRAPIECMELMKRYVYVNNMHHWTVYMCIRWISCCKTIEEVRLDGNLIGDPAAKELLNGLKCRKEGL